MSPLVPVAVVSAGYLFARPLLSALGMFRDAASDAARAAAKAKRGEREAKLKITKLLEREKREAERAQAGTKPQAGSKPQPVPEIPREFPVTLHEPPPPPPEPKADTLGKLGNEKPTKKSAAERLYAYVSREIREGRSSNLGTKGHPNAQVRQGQKDMGNVKDDGIYGPKTAARGKELTGKPWPRRQEERSKPSKPQPVPSLPPPPLPPGPAPTLAPPAPPEPVPVRQEAPVVVPSPQRSPVDAASALYTYAVRAAKLPYAQASAAFGTGSAPNPTVREAQSDMGELLADGIYGPVTRKRGAVLIGKTFPARPSKA